MASHQALILAGQWSQEFVHVMEAMADLRPEMATADGSSSDGKYLWWKQSLDAAPRATVWIGTPEETWVALGQQILTAAGVESTSQEEVRSSYLEVLRQSMSAFANSLGSQVGGEVNCTEGGEQAPPTQTAVCRLSIKAADKSLPDFVFRANQELLDVVSKAARGEDAAPPPAAAPEGPGSGHRGYFVAGLQYAGSPAGRGNAGQRFVRTDAGPHSRHPQAHYRLHHRTGSGNFRAGGSDREQLRDRTRRSGGGRRQLRRAN
jgi:hypothetical protein